MQAPLGFMASKPLSLIQALLREIHHWWSLLNDQYLGAFRKSLKISLRFSQRQTSGFVHFSTAFHSMRFFFSTCHKLWKRIKPFIWRRPLFPQLNTPLPNIVEKPQLLQLILGIITSEYCSKKRLFLKH